MPVLTAMVFLGATLLFGMEPLVGRILVPYFGGAANVWLTTLMFFQAMLLVGYLYAHLCAPRLGRWHLLLLFLPFINLPLGVTTTPSPGTPLLTLLLALLSHFALPFAVLSTTAVVAQSWLASSVAGERQEPYPLYAASNAGSLLALFGYAFLAEPLLGVRLQSYAWTGAYMIYAVLVVAAWFALRPRQGALSGSAAQDGPDLSADAPPTARDYLVWLLLSALPSGFLLTVTNFIALEVGSFPLVWVLPLALYLSSFVVTFRTDGGVPKWLAAIWPEVVILGFLLYFMPMLVWVALSGSLLVLLAVCLVAHGTLYEGRPPVRFLTHYYLSMAVGGFLGGAIISIFTPRLFKGLYEYPLILAALALVFWRCCPTSFPSCRPDRPSVLRWLRVGGSGVMLAGLGIFMVAQIKEISTIKFRHRNFYGTYCVQDDPPSVNAPAGFRKLVHGKTLHGGQFLDQKRRSTPTFYYHDQGAFGEVYRTVLSPRRVAIVGMGAGVESAYCSPDDALTYYEIDPDNEKIARTWFTYLNDARGQVRVVPGDGRLSLQATGKEVCYDLITIDAFSGDGIPTHLLTREAMQEYLNHLASDGIILFHISNRYYDLRAVIKSTSAPLQLFGAMNIRLPQALGKTYDFSAQCVVLARNPERLKQLIALGWIPFGEGDGLEQSSPWTDDYINLLAPLCAKIWPQSSEKQRSIHTAANLDATR